MQAEAQEKEKEKQMEHEKELARIQAEKDAANVVTNSHLSTHLTHDPLTRPLSTLILCSLHLRQSDFALNTRTTHLGMRLFTVAFTVF